MRNQCRMPAPATGADAADTGCRGCGACCRKGGPALHAQDLKLFRTGRLAPEHCLTLRAGEPARHLDGEVRPLERELVKLRPRQGAPGGDWTCLFLHQPGNRCARYAHRPAECRALLCRDVRAITALHGVDRVTRLDVLAAWAAGAGERAAPGRRGHGAPGGCADPGMPWAGILAAHEERCGYAALARVGAALQRPADAAPATETFLEAVRFDLAFRSLLRERAGVTVEELDFLLGRTLAAAAGMYGVAVRMTREGPELVRPR